MIKLFTGLFLIKRNRMQIKQNMESIQEIPPSGTLFFKEDSNISSEPFANSSVIGEFHRGDFITYDSLVSNDNLTFLAYKTKSGEQRYAIAVNYLGDCVVCSTDPRIPTPITVEGGLSIPLYLQWQYDTPYGSGTIQTSGCGPTSFAMVCSYLLDKQITPDVVVNWAQNKYYQPGVGTYWSFFAAAAQHFGVKKPIQTPSQLSAYTALKNNQAVICSQSKGLFTRGGHFIVLRGLDNDGKVLVNDPNDTLLKEYKDRHFDFDSEIAITSKQFWIFYPK